MAASELQIEALRQLREERMRRNLTQLEAATLMGVSLSVFQRMEIDRNRDVRVSTLERYATALGKHLEVRLTD